MTMPERSKLLERLLAVTRNLGASMDLNGYLRSVLSAAAELTGSETASLLGYDEATGDLYFRFVPWFHKDAISAARIPLNASAAGWAFQNIKPLIISDAANDPRHYSKIDELAGFTTRSLLAVPLLYGGKPVGVMEIFNKTGEAAFDEQDILIAESLASLAAIAMQTDELEQNVISYRSEARDLDRLKNEFIAITSHELRTPLGLILGHSTFLRELIGDAHEEQVDAIIRNAARLKEIIESLTRVDNYQAGVARVRQRKLSITRVIEDVCASFREMADQKNITLALKAGAADLYVDADGSKVTIALSNLVKNAILFTNTGGHVIVSCEMQSSFVMVSVEDDGVGIPASELPLVFDRFYQVESHLTRKHGGMGLGLSVAKVMIEMHGGRIWAESTEGVGSTFRFLLPLGGDEPPAAPSSAFVQS